MTITYFKETDSLLISLNNNPVEETKDFSENILLDFDNNKNLVSITIEHAAKTASIANFTFNQIENKNAVC